MTYTCDYVETVCDTQTGGSGLITALSNVFSNQPTVLRGGSGPTNQATPAHEVPQGPQPDGTTVPAHVKQVQRIGPGGDRTAAVDGLLTAIGNNPTVEWYAIRVHECQHDLTTGEGTDDCPEDSIATASDGTLARKGSVPEGI